MAFHGSGGSAGGRPPSAPAAEFGERILAFQADALQPWAVVAADAIAEVAAFCKSDKALAFDNLMCLSAVDYPKETPPRLELVYHLWSYAHAHGFVLKVHLPRESPSVADGRERLGRRQLARARGLRHVRHHVRRALRPAPHPAADDWIGFPLRKDWVDPDFYNGMHVKPTPQMAERSMAGEKIAWAPSQ
jgi:NADH-quinone oxidoreductase subunit C